MNRRPLTAGRHNSRQRLPKPQTVSETPQNKQTPMRRDLIAAPRHPHITSTATIHLGDAPSSGSDTCIDTRIIPHRRGFSADANPHTAKTRERSGLVPEIDARFTLFQVLSHEFVSLLNAKQTGTSYPAVRDKDVRAMSIRVAPSSEQARIVTAIEEHFSRLDATDTALAAAQRRLDALRRSAAAELFDRPDWTWTTLSEIAELKGGVTKDSKREADPEYVEYPYLRVANVQRGFLDLSVITTIRADRHKAEKLVLQHGDILFNEGGDRDKLGRGWVWEGQIENCIHQNHVFRARLANGGFDPYFISMHANTWGQRWFERHGKQTTNLASINLATLKSFPVPAPSLDEQRAVVSELQSIMRTEDRLRTDIDQAERHSKTLRRSILSAAFSGQLVPQDPQDEPASVLLERIAASRMGKSV